jgi:hypothetical protein
MKNITQILENSILQQLTLEEELYKKIEQHLLHPNLTRHPDAKEILHGAKEILRKHYDHLNLALDQISLGKNEKKGSALGSFITDDSEIMNGANQESVQEQISKMLHDDYVALNVATIGNAFIHTMALAAESKEIADASLEHLANLALYIIRMNELVPIVLARELSDQFPDIRKDISEIALRNIQSAWQRQNATSKNQTPKY